MGRKKDKYECFEDLAAEKVEGVDYQINIDDRSSVIAVVAPHGGTIEPTTSEIASAIAGDRLSLYRFEGLKPDIAHEELHITSEQFNEPKACRLVENAETVVGVHGRADNGDPQTVWVGGLDFQRRDRIVAELARNGFVAEIRQPGQALAGAARRNICNRGTTKAGVQLEIPRTLRDWLRDNLTQRVAFAAAVRKGIDLP